MAPSFFATVTFAVVALSLFLSPASASWLNETLVSACFLPCGLHILRTPENVWVTVEMLTHSSKMVSALCRQRVSMF